MPKPLEVDYSFVKWRISTEDLELLHLLFPGKVNEVARTVLHSYCEHIRAHVGAGVGMLQSLEDR